MIIVSAMFYPPALKPDFAPRLNQAVADPPLITPLIDAPRALIRRCSARCSLRCSVALHPAFISLTLHRIFENSAPAAALKKHFSAVPRAEQRATALAARISTISAVKTVASRAILADQSGAGHGGEIPCADD